MMHFYDGQIRRYITQTIRVFSNFVVKYGDGTLHRVPVLYGDPDRQVSSIIRNNSENSVNSVPRIAVYVSSLELDRDRLSDATFVGKMHIRERDVVDGTYTQSQGKNYTVERLMPTPFLLTMKVDIWSSNTDQKLQILEQLLVLFNPSLELQTSDNYVDWTALTVLDLFSVSWSSRTVPVGTDSPIDIATLTVKTPIWISPPAKVKHLGVITRIINSIFNSGSIKDTGYIEGLGEDLGGGTTTFGELLSADTVTIGGFNIQVYDKKASLLESTNFAQSNIQIALPAGAPLSWQTIFDQYPGKYIPGSSAIFVTQSSGAEVRGTIVLNEMEPTVLHIEWDETTYEREDDLTSNPITAYTSVRTGSPSTFDAIIDPTRVYPGHGMINPLAGDRFLIIDDIGNIANQDGPDGWKSTNGDDFYAHANDIVEYDGATWHVLFDAVQDQQPLLQANIYNNIRVQYSWDGVSWIKSFEGDYRAGAWRIVL